MGHHLGCCQCSLLSPERWVLSAGLAHGVFHLRDVRFGSGSRIPVVIVVPVPKPLQSHAQKDGEGERLLHVHRHDQPVVTKGPLILTLSPLAEAIKLSPTHPVPESLRLQQMRWMEN